MSVCNDPTCASCKLPLWAQVSSTSLSKEVREAGEVVKAHQMVYGADHVPCEARSEAEGYKARCCLCLEHSSGCELHRIGKNGRSRIQDMA